MAEVREKNVNGVSTFSQTRARDKAELRAAIQDQTLLHTTMLRDRLLPVIREKHPEWSVEMCEAEAERLQPVYGEYDPVVAMSMIAVDHSNPVDLRLKAHSEVAQYVRPKLKSIEMTVDPASAEELATRRELASRLVGLLEVAMLAKQGQTIEGTARESTYDPDASVEDTDEDT